MHPARVAGRLEATACGAVADCHGSLDDNRFPAGSHWIQVGTRRPCALWAVRRALRSRDADVGADRARAAVPRDEVGRGVSGGTWAAARGLRRASDAIVPRGAA